VNAGEKLKAWRTARKPKLSQAALGEILGVSDASVCLWESEDKLPSTEYRDAIERLTDGAVPAIEWGDEAEQERFRRLRELEPLSVEEPAESGPGDRRRPTEGAA